MIPIITIKRIARRVEITARYGDELVITGFLIWAVVTALQHYLPVDESLENAMAEVTKELKRKRSPVIAIPLTIEPHGLN